MKSINSFKIWWKKGNNFKMDNQIYFTRGSQEPV
jgi:hypothetical protein